MAPWQLDAKMAESARLEGQLREASTALQKRDACVVALELEASRHQALVKAGNEELAQVRAAAEACEQLLAASARDEAERTRAREREMAEQADELAACRREMEALAGVAQGLRQQVAVVEARACAQEEEGASLRQQLVSADGYG
jgi:hypothetical protein